jgi:hypothetical protein
MSIKKISTKALAAAIGLCEVIKISKGYVPGTLVRVAELHGV